MLKKDRLTIAVTVIAAFALVVGVFAFTRLWIESLPPVSEDFNGKTDYTNEIALTMETFTHNHVNYSVVSINASGTMWDRVSVALGIGSDGHTWNPALGDLSSDGTRAYLGEWGSSGLLGNWDYWFNLTDADGDMCISRGDFFTVETGGVVSFESGRTYAITIEGDAYARVTFGD